MTYNKDFEGWHALKSTLNEQTPRTFQEREIWWCSIGINVGHETDGKSDYYNRPVLVVRKFNRYMFFGVPLSTQIKSTPHYFPLSFKGRDQSVLLTQLRLWDARRLSHKMGQLSDSDFKKITTALSALITK